MIRRNIMILDICMRISIVSLQVVVKILDCFAWCAQKGTKIFSVWLLLMTADKLGAITIFSAYYFKNAFYGLFICYFCYGTSLFLKLIINDEFLYHMECQADKILRNMIEQKYKKRPVIGR